MARLLTLGLLLAATASFAASNRLIPQRSLLTLMPDSDVTGASAATVPEPHIPTLVASGAAAALFSSPVALALGAWAGTLSNNLYAALLPALLIAAIVPSVATVVTEWMVAERSGKGRFRLIPTLLVTFVAQLGLMAGGLFLGVNATNGSGIAIMTLASTVVLPTVTTAMLKVTERAPIVSVPVVAGNF